MEFSENYSISVEKNDYLFGINNTFYMDENTIEISNPEEMLQPQIINAFFFHIVITHTITFVIGFLGNIFTVLVMLGDKNSRNATNFFLVSLAVSDLLLILLCIPLETLQYFLVQWNRNGVLCVITRYVELLSASASVLNLCAVSLERFIVIVFPMRSRSLCTLSNCRKAILLVWIIAIFLAAPVVPEKSGYSIIYRNPERNVSVTIFYCKEEDAGLALALYKLIILFVAPGLLMMICYTYVIRELWRSTRNINLLTNAKSFRTSGHTSANTSTGGTDYSGSNFPESNRKKLTKSLRNGKALSFKNENKSTRFRDTTAAGTPFHLSSSKLREKPKSRQNRGEDVKKARKQVIKMLILVIILFLVCWGPKLILSFGWKLASRMGFDLQFTPFWYLVRVIFNLIPFVHCCFNFFLYFYFNKSFRKQIYRICSSCGCKCKCIQPPCRNTILMRTTATTRLQVVDSYSSNFYQEGLSTRHTEVECVSAI